MGHLLLPLAMVAGLAAGLQLESIGQPRNRSVLLIVAGLCRHCEITWPKIEQSFLLPNEAAGYVFRIVFDTDTSQGCHSNSSKWRSRKCEEPAERELQARHVREVFAPRTVRLFGRSDPCAAATAPSRPAAGRRPRRGRTAKPGGAAGRPRPAVARARAAAAPGRPATAVPLAARRPRAGESYAGAPVALLEEEPALEDSGSELEAAGSSRSCLPWFARVHRVLARVAESGEEFDRVVALRPDMVMHWASGAAQASQGAPPQLKLDSMCAQRPGFSFVTPTWEIKVSGALHNKDLDFMHVLCPGHLLSVYEDAIRDVWLGCNDGGGFPALPPGFISTRGWTARNMYCRMVRVFSSRGIPMAHWDDTYALDWVDAAEIP